MSGLFGSANYGPIYVIGNTGSGSGTGNATYKGAWGSFKAKDPVAFDERVKAKFPMGRAGKPEEIAPLVSFLCSEYTSFISGACIPVDGGESYSF